MIEQAIFTAIGFLAAALLALAAAPAITRRARRLAEARARLQAPLTEAQAVADRDALRAQHAIERVRLEQRLEAVAETAARRQIELGRRLAELVALDETSSARAAEIGRQRDELAAIKREALDLEAQLGGAQFALNDLTVQRDSARAAFAASDARRRELATLADEQRTRIATLETRLAAAEIRLVDDKRAAAAAIKAAQAEKARLEANLSDRKQMAGRLETDLETATARNAKLTSDLASARGRLGEAEALLARSEIAREEALLENGRQLARIAERDAALRALGGERLSATAQAAEVPTLGGDAVAAGELASRLVEAQREIEHLRARLAAPSAGSRAAGDQALRNAIARLGREVVGHGRKPRASKSEASNLVSFERRDGPAPLPPSGAEALHSAPAGKILQGQPMAPER